MNTNINLANADSADFSLLQKVHFLIETLRDMDEKEEAQTETVEEMESDLKDLKRWSEEMPEADEIVTSENLDEVLEDKLNDFVTERNLEDALEEYAEDRDLDRVRDRLDDLSEDVSGLYDKMIEQFESMPFRRRLRWLFTGRI